MEAKTPIIIEQEIEPLIGTRLFKVNSDFKLVGLSTRNLVWDTTTIQAACLKEVNAKVPTPELYARCEEHLRKGIDCTCGVYLVLMTTPEIKVDAHKAHDYWQRIPVNNYLEVEAVCKAWGVCIEGTMGMRCQYVTMQSLNVLLKPCKVCTLYTAEYYKLDTNDCWCPVCVPKIENNRKNTWRSILNNIQSIYNLPMTFIDLQLVNMYYAGEIVGFPMPTEIISELKKRLPTDLAAEEDRKLAILKMIKNKHENDG